MNPDPLYTALSVVEYICIFLLIALMLWAFFMGIHVLSVMKRQSKDQTEHLKDIKEMLNEAHHVGGERQRRLMKALLGENYAGDFGGVEMYTNPAVPPGHMYAVPPDFNQTAVLKVKTHSQDSVQTAQFSAPPQGVHHHLNFQAPEA